MATRPSSSVKWAEILTTEAGNFGGVVSQIQNREAIPTDLANTGWLLEEPPARRHINQLFYLLGLWQQHLDERYKIGDVHLTISTEDAATISARLGGTWVQRGTQTTGTITSKVWEKTA